MIGTVGLNDGEISHDVLDVDRVGLRVLVEEVDLTLCIRDLELDPGVDSGSVEQTVVKPDEVIVLFLAAVTAVGEVSGGDVGSIASKTGTVRAVEAVKLKQVIKKSETLVDGITKLVVGEGGFSPVRCDGNDVVCPYVLCGNPSLKHLAVKVITSVLNILLVHWSEHLSHAHLAQGVVVVLLAKSTEHVVGALLDRFQYRWSRFDRIECPFALVVTMVCIVPDLDHSRYHSKGHPVLER